MTRLRVDLLVAEDPPQDGVAQLLDAHHRLGHHTRLIHLTRKPSSHRNGPAPAQRPADVAHSRASSLWALPLQRQMEDEGLLIVNTTDAQRVGRDKQLCAQLLAAADVATLPAVLTSSDTTAASVVEQLGDDVVIKPLTGHSGHGITRAHGLETITRALARANGPRLVQPFADTGGQDLRLVVIGDQVAAAYRRTAPPGDFRTNSALPGARMETCIPPAETIGLARSAARACGLDIAGIDISITNRYGPAVLEANTNSGIAQGLPTLTGRDLATEMARHVATLAVNRRPPTG
ncbi:RimK family alpha-L-glutamate ligase [Streptomyces sp. HK10]|uniref:ATP-grasp domain-containing protein n=1 Tax=Streptomyces sp. HK10 TaxID=3373255 RepID=UPI0037480F91